MTRTATLSAAAVTLALSLQACTGLYLSLPDEDSGREPDIKVQPITPELVTHAAIALKTAASSTLAGVSGPYVYHVGVGDILDISIPSIASVPVTLIIITAHSVPLTAASEPIAMLPTVITTWLM